MRQYKTKEGYSIRTIGREKKVYFTSNGGAYFLWNGRRQSLEEIERLSYPVFYEDENGKTGFCSGCITISNCYGVLVELSECCEAVTLYETVEEATA